MFLASLLPSIFSLELSLLNRNQRFSQTLLIDKCLLRFSMISPAFFMSLSADRGNYCQLSRSKSLLLLRVWNSHAWNRKSCPKLWLTPCYIKIALRSPYITRCLTMCKIRRDTGVRSLEFPPWFLLLKLWDFGQVTACKSVRACFNIHQMMKLLTNVCQTKGEDVCESIRTEILNITSH